jgi:hypothetical protein
MWNPFASKKKPEKLEQETETSVAFDKELQKAIDDANEAVERKEKCSMERASTVSSLGRSIEDKAQKTFDSSQLTPEQQKKLREEMEKRGLLPT